MMPLVALFALTMIRIVSSIFDIDSIFIILRFFSHLVRNAMDIFRAVVANGEFSLRALELTSYLLHVNAGNYSVWLVCGFEYFFCDTLLIAFV